MAAEHLEQNTFNNHVFKTDGTLRRPFEIDFSLLYTDVSIAIYRFLPTVFIYFLLFLYIYIVDTNDIYTLNVFITFLVLMFLNVLFNVLLNCSHATGITSD